MNLNLLLRKGKFLLCHLQEQLLKIKMLGDHLKLEAVISK